MLKKLTFIVLTTILLNACSSYNVIKVDSSTIENSGEGYYYALPRTIITIDISVTKNDVYKGVYAEYASKYLGIKNASQSNVTTYELSDIRINSYAEPDPDNFYFVDLNKYRASKSQSMFLCLRESGLIQDINDNSDAAIKQEEKALEEKNSINYAETFKYFADDNLVEKIDTIFEKVNIDTATIEKMILKRTFVEKSMEEKAKEASEFIKKIKAQRFDILTGAQEVAYSDATIKVMISELERLEKEYLMLFIGTTSKETLHYRYYYIPESQVYSASVPLFRFSKFTGIVADNYEAGEVVSIRVDRSQNTQKLEAFMKTATNGKSTHGFYYRIPEYAKFSINQGKVIKAEAAFLVNQFGLVASLPPANLKVQFFPNTGAIRKVEMR